jgi:hypothetical protein
MISEGLVFKKGEKRGKNGGFLTQVFPKFLDREKKERSTICSANWRGRVPVRPGRPKSSKGGLTLTNLSRSSLPQRSAKLDACFHQTGLVGWWPGDGNANDIQLGSNGVLTHGATFTLDY